MYYKLAVVAIVNTRLHLAPKRSSTPSIYREIEAYAIYIYNAIYLCRSNDIRPAVILKHRRDRYVIAIRPIPYLVLVPIRAIYAPPLLVELSGMVRSSKVGR